MPSPTEKGGEPGIPNKESSYLRRPDQGTADGRTRQDPSNYFEGIHLDGKLMLGSASRPGQEFVWGRKIPGLVPAGLLFLELPMNVARNVGIYQK